MKKKFTVFIITISVSATLLMFLLGLFVTNSSNIKQAEDKAVAVAGIYFEAYTGDNNIIKKTDEHVRVTIIDADGMVIADTDMRDVSFMDNHLSREEVLSAYSGNPATVKRTSESSGEDMIYYAVKKDVGDSYVFIRVAVTISSVNNYLISTIPLTLALLLAVATVSVILGLFLGDRLLRPLGHIKSSLSAINRGDYIKKLPQSGDPEIDKMLTEIDEIDEQLEKNVSSLKEERAKLDFIINNINNAVIVLNSDKSISVINEYAKRIFELDDGAGENINIIEYNKRLYEAINASITSGQDSVFEIDIDHTDYLVTVKTLTAEWTSNEKICAVILSDITSTKESERIRREFFQNAGHELKSPLTSIIGFSELLEMDNENTKLVPVIEKISKESARMLVLVEDMLKLSRLDSLAEQTERKKLELSVVARDVVDALAPVCGDKNITLTVSGEAVLTADYDNMYSLIKNLAENAVRYNRPGGKAEISISDEGRTVKLKVTDTGIGIESKHQTRIFERFYRVDKSRSRKAGGTGLGLAIVKHICVLYDADLNIKSKIGLGTSVSVTFKK